MTKKILTKSLSIDRASEFIQSFSNNNYYLIASKNTTFNDEINIDQPYDTENYITSVYKDMIFGKKIKIEDLSYVIPRYNWTYGTVYTQYDDSDLSLYNKNFYITTQEGDNYHVYKCIFNNNNANSIVQPTYSSIDVEDQLYETSDGYIWKYMYSVSSSEVSKFATIEYFPVKLNSNVSSNAKVGSIDNIKVENIGRKYDNYISGMNYFGFNQIRQNGNTILYDISSNNSASSINDFYNGCYIYITSGTGSGQYKKIVSYNVNSTSKSIVLENEFAIPISVDSSYQIYPGVIINGNGTETINAIAIAVVNSVSNTIYKVDMIEKGLNYQEAFAYVYAHPSVPKTDAQLRVINSPYFGHGYNSIEELNGKRVCIGITIANSESNTIPTSNDYRTIGLIKNPLYANVSVETLVKNGDFINGEKIVNIRPRLLNSNIEIISNTNYINTASNNFNLQLNVGEYIYIRKNNQHFIDYVTSVSNNSITLNSNITFNSNSTSYANLYVTELFVNSYIISTNSSHINLANVSEPLYYLDKFIGLDSKAYMEINNISISNTYKSFDTFINMYKFDCNIVSGAFEEDEYVYQGSSYGIYNSTLFSNGVTSIYLNNVNGNLIANGTSTITGNTSGTVAILNNKYLPEIVFKSGKMLFLENLVAITRDPLQSEKFKLIFEF